MKQILIALAAAAALGSAHAGPFTIDNGIDFGSNGSTSTSALNSLGFNQSLSTMIFTDGNANIGSSVVITNSSTTLNNYNFSGSGLDYPVDPAEVNINSLAGPSLDRNGFRDGESDPFEQGPPVRWGLTYGYTLYGTVTAGGFVNYTGGTIEMFYRDDMNPANAIKVAELDLTSSVNATNRLSWSGVLDYSWADPSNDFVNNFFKDVNNNALFADISRADPDAMLWTFEAVESPNVIEAAQLSNPVTTQGGDVLFRQSQMSGSVTFNVPEPASIALVGLALTGLAVATRRRKQA